MFEYGSDRKANRYEREARRYRKRIDKNHENARNSRGEPSAELKQFRWEHKVRLWRADCRCCYCRNPMSLAETTLEHVIRLADGGKDEPGNYAIAHHACNNLRGKIAARNKIQAARVRGRHKALRDAELDGDTLEE